MVTVIQYGREIDALRAAKKGLSTFIDHSHAQCHIALALAQMDIIDQLISYLYEEKAHYTSRVQRPKPFIPDTLTAPGT